MLREGGFDFKWTSEGGLRKWEVIDAIRSHPVTGEESWANMITAMHCSVFDNHPDYPTYNRDEQQRAEPCQMHGQMPYDTSFGDNGEAFPVSYLHAMRKAQWRHSVAFDYQPGDLLVIDNYLAQHGRFSWEQEDGPREIFMGMVAPRE